MKLGIQGSMLIILTAASIGTGARVQLNMKSIEFTESRLRAVDSSIDSLSTSVAKRIRALEDENKAIRLEVEKASERIVLANERIEYYRDVLQIVSKTCPGRMRLPVLTGDPGRKTTNR